MVEASITSFWDRIENNWENKTGLILALILAMLFYYFGIMAIVNDAWKNKFPILSFIILPILIISAIVLTWFISTNRYFIRTKEYISVGIIVICDEDTYQSILRKILKKVILYLNDRHNNLNIRLLPTNICRNGTELNKYHTNNQYQYDLLIHLNLDGGKFDSIEKIEIKSLGVTFNLDGSSRKVIINNVVDLFHDTSVQVASKNWAYLLENSGIDKDKYIQNLNQIIVYYTSLYAIFSNNYEDALLLLKTIYNPPKDGLIVNLDAKNKKFLHLKTVALAQGRIGAILTELYFESAIASYQKADTNTAIKKFEELASLINNHPLLFIQYISMARFSYELGNVKDAKIYTEKANKLIPNNINCYLNLAFFAILDNDAKEMCVSYREMYNRKNTMQLNWVDILDFQLKQQKLIRDRDELFSFSTLMLEAVFLDNSKLNELHKLVLDYENKPQLAIIGDLGKYILEKEGVIKYNTKTNTHPVNHPRIKKKQNKQSRRKKKRR